jgi:hypothetical protein
MAFAFSVPLTQPIDAVAAMAPSPDAARLEPVVAYGRAEQRIDNTVAASEGTIGESELSVRPLLRAAELWKPCPA